MKCGKVLFGSLAMFVAALPTGVRSDGSTNGPTTGSDGLQGKEEILPGSRSDIHTAFKDSEVVVVARFVKVRFREFGGLGCSYYAGQIAVTRTAKGEALRTDLTSFVVASVIRHEVPPAVDKTYILFLRTTGVNQPDVLKILPATSRHLDELEREVTLEQAADTKEPGADEKPNNKGDNRGRAPRSTQES